MEQLDSLFVAIILLFILIATYELVRFSLLIKRSQRLIDKSGLYQRVLPDSSSRIVVVGDSAAVGVGATDLQYTIGGRLGKDFPRTTIETYAESGRRLKDLRVLELPVQHADIIVVTIGANDIVHFTPMAAIESLLTDVVKSLKQKSKNIIILHGGNVGACKAFPIPIRIIYDFRTRAVRDIYKRVTQAENIGYVDMYTTREVFPYHVGGISTFALDRFHPSDQGYAIWHELIVKEIHRQCTSDELNRMYGILPAID